MEQVACGEIGLTLNYFYSLTPREFDNIVIGYRRKEETQYRTGWEQSRFIVQTLIAPHLKKGSKFDYKFPWEEGAVPVKDKKQLAKEAKAFWDNVDAERIK